MSGPPDRNHRKQRNFSGLEIIIALGTLNYRIRMSNVEQLIFVQTRVSDFLSSIE